MMNKYLIAFIGLLSILSSCFGSGIIYYCPTPEDFKNINNKLIATTRFHGYSHTWQTHDSISTQFPEYPLTFKGANLINCRNNLCDLRCYYYSNIEGHIITSTIKSDKIIFIFEHPNRYLFNFSCQYTEHVDCPFIINI